MSSGDENTHPTNGRVLIMSIWLRELRKSCETNKVGVHLNTFENIRNVSTFIAISLAWNVCFQPQT